MIAVILLAKLTIFLALSRSVDFQPLERWLAAMHPWSAVAVRLALVLLLSLTSALPVMAVARLCRPRPDDAYEDLLRKRLRLAYLRSLPALWVLAVFQVQVWVLKWPFVWPGARALAQRGESAFLLGGLVPLLVGIVLAWLLWYDVERSLHPVPVGRGPYVWYKLRSQVGFILVPLAFILVSSDLLDMVARWDNPLGHAVAWAGELLVVALALLAMPLLVRLTWATRSLERGPVRSMLEKLCKETKVRYRDILLWRTPGASMTNAAVLGLIGPLRYLLVTDGMLQVSETDELRAVFAHELGHVRKHHIPFFILYIVTFLGLLMLMGQWLPLPPELGLSGYPVRGNTTVGLVVLAAVSLAYWAWGFGFVSRRFERQADVYCLSMGISPASLIAAFRKIAAATGLPATVRSWRHFSLARRIDFLQKVMDDPTVAEEFETKVQFLKGALVAGAIVVWALLIVDDLRQRGIIPSTDLPWAIRWLVSR